jgi:hypothetical protein
MNQMMRIDELLGGECLREAIGCGTRRVPRPNPSYLWINAGSNDTDAAG